MRSSATGGRIPTSTDRVARARWASGELPLQPDSTEEMAYRRDLGRRLSALAGSVLDEPTAIFLQRAALRAAFGSESSLEVEHDLLRMRAARLGMRKPILRAYGPLVADYDSLRARASRQSAPAEFLAGLRAERDSLDRQRRDTLRAAGGDPGPRQRRHSLPGAVPDQLPG